MRAYLPARCLSDIECAPTSLPPTRALSETSRKYLIGKLGDSAATAEGVGKSTKAELSESKAGGEGVGSQ